MIKKVEIPVTLFKFNILILVFSLIIAGNIFARNFDDSNHAPWNYQDFGGTPDLQSDRELTLSEIEMGELIKKLESDELSARITAAEEIMRNAEGAENNLKKFLWKGPFPRNAQLKEAIKKASALNDENKQGELIQNLLKSKPSEVTTAALKIMVMLNALNSLNTLAGYKVMMSFSKRHAGVFRMYIGKMLVNNGFEVLPALIYGRGSKDDEMHMFSVKWIRDLGDPLLSEQVQGIKNSRRLAQLIESYASVNELDAINVTLSLASHNSVWVRNASRKALVSYGANAKWAIFREYENIFDEEPKSGSQMEDWLQSLYNYWDKNRVEPFLKDFDKANGYRKKGDFVKMDSVYRNILSFEPLFEKREKMAEDYLQYASVLEKNGKTDTAVEMYKMVKRLSATASLSFKKANSRIESIEQDKNVKNGILDREYFSKNSLKIPAETSAVSYYITAIIVSFFIFISTILVFLRIKRGF